MNIRRYVIHVLSYRILPQHERYFCSVFHKKNIYIKLQDVTNIKLLCHDVQIHQMPPRLPEMP